MNRVTKVLAWLAIWLFIASALAIFPGAAAAHWGIKPKQKA
jgi:hypothetical protein